MKWTVPRWVIVFLLTVMTLTAVLGFWAETVGWAATHPFGVNLLSSLTGFAASGAFAVTVLNWMTRRRFARVELDARTSTVLAAEFALRDLLSLFGLTAFEASPDEVLAKAVERAELDAEINLAPPGQTDDLDWQFAILEQTTHRFAFLPDGDLAYLTGRASRKISTFRDELVKAWKGELDVVPHELLVAAMKLAESLVELRAWAFRAPTRGMKRAVADRAFQSDLR